ncbi:hypothetical protein GQ53DRAFT_790105 [Thozetella sp. PMI_491]|nr:hypothetical protein GQ53DRAFT_790105 [Thozetella sp. PMI_491]
MKMKNSLVFALIGASSRPVNAANGCNDDNCARAVTGTRRGPSFSSTAQSDCAAFMVVTEYGHTAYVFSDTLLSTVTVTTPVAPTSKTVPTYASACSGTSRYASACSCWGVTSTTVSKPDQTTTTTVSTSTVPTGPGYTPAIPSSYANCVFDPASGAPFELLDPNGLSIINKDGKAVEQSDPTAPVDPFTFSHPAGAPSGVYDVVLTSGGKQLFLAVFKSGAVGFVESSSNGQTYVGSGDQYVTSIWSVECDSLTTAGIIGGIRFQFVVKTTGEIVATASAAARKTRDIPVPEGFYIMPQATPTAPGSKCPSPEQHATTKNPPVPVTSNGCGPEGFWGYFVPNFEFVDACNFHDVCWADCSETFTGCNTEFLNRMTQTCDANHDAGSVLHGTCIKIANFYYSKVSGDYAAGHYTETIQEYCDCKCNDDSLTACGDKCVDTKTDPDNCGSCDIHCPTNSCTNGACSFNSCLGQTCATFGPCGPGGSCVCASIADHTGFCVDGNTPCAGLATCGNSGDCPLGAVCAVGTCCGGNVCITTDVCGGFNLPRHIFAPRAGWQNATIGHLAGYVS